MAKGFNLTAEINLRGPSNLRQVASNIRKQLGNINTNVNVQINQQTAKQISIANKSFSQFNKTLKQTQTIASSTSKSLSQLANSAGKLSLNLQKVPAQIASAAQGANQISQSNQKAAQATNALTSEFAEFGRQSALAVRRFAAFATVTGVIYKVSNAVTSATKDFLDFEKELIKVAQVSRTPVAQLDFLTKNITRLSTNLGVASKDLVGVSRTLAQAGLSANDTSKALQALARSALAPTFDDMNRTVEGSIALMRQFSIGANQLEGALGSINAVAGKFAVEAGDIITAISRAGGVFASASKGVSEGTDALNEFIAVFTSVRATTRESAETIATGLRTIFTRIQRSDTIDALKAFGITLTDLEGKFVGPYKAIQLLSQGLKTLDPRDLRFGRIVEELGGFRQIGKVIPLIQQFTTAQRALNVAQQGTGSLARDAAVAQQSLANQIQKVNEQFTAFIRSVAGSQGFKDLTRAVLDISSALISVADAAKGALPALTAIFAIKGFKALTQFSGGFLGGIKRGTGNTLNTGGYVRGYARGGMVPGTGNRDTVPAMLTPGEFVIKKSSVSKLGPSTLAAMNENRFSQKSRGPGAGNVQAKKKNQGIATYKLSHTVGQLAAYGDDTLLGPKTSTTGAFTLGQLANKYNVADAKKRIKSGQSPKAPTKVTGKVVNLKLGEESGKAFGGDEWLNPGLAQIDKKVNQGLRKLNLKGSKSPLAKDEAVRQKIEGFTLESFISGLLGKSAEGGSEAFDFKNIDTKALSDFSIRSRPPKYLDSKRTLIARSEIIKKGVDDEDVKVRAMATGGSVEDTVPALLTPGEFVINKKSAARLGPAKLHALNKGQRIRGYNKGGFVDGVQTFANGGLVDDVISGGGFSPKDAAMLKKAAQKNVAAFEKLARLTDGWPAEEVGSAFKRLSRQINKGVTELDDEFQAIALGQKGTRGTGGAQRGPSRQDRIKARQIELEANDTRTSADVVQQRVDSGGLSRSGDDMAFLARESDKAAVRLKAQFRPEAAGKALNAYKGTLIKTGSTTRAMAAAIQQGVNTTKQLNASSRKFSMTLDTSMPTLRKAMGSMATAFKNAKARIDKIGEGKFMQGMQKFGTALAFAGPMLADQVGNAVGGTTGAGIAGAATGMSTAVAIGSQLGPIGTFVGVVAGAVMAFDGYNKAVAQKEVELANTKIDKAVESNQKSLEKLSKNINDVAARRESTRNIQAIRQAEIDKAAASERAAQPGLLSRGLNFVSGGYLGGDRRTSEDRIGARVSANQAGAQASQSRIDAELAAGKSLRELDEQLRKNGGSLRNLYTDIVEADSSYQEEVQVIQDKNMAESLKTKAINDLKKKYVAQVATGFQAQQAEIDKAKAAKKLATAMRVQTASLTRTFSNLNQSIQASSDSLQNASQELQNIVSGATGFTANLDSLSVLNNPAAFSRSEQNNAIRQGSQFAGQDAAFMQQLARFSLDADQIIASGAARAQRSGSTGDRVNVAKDTVNRLTKRLEDALGSNQLTNGIRNQLIAAIDDAVKSGDDIDLQKLIEESGFSQSLDASKQVFDALKNSAQFLENAMNFAAKGANEYSKQTQLLRDNQARYQQIILQSGLSLKKALGQRVGVRETIDARTRTAATRAGVSADQFSAQNLVQRREGLQKEADRIKKSLNKLAQSSDNASTSASKAFLGLTKKLGDTESKLKAVDNAIQNLPSTIEANINDVIGEIGRIVQEQQALQQAGGQFAEQLVGSTPQELANLSSSFNILERTLAGQSNTIQQSQAAQMAYYQALQNGSTQQEAYNAAQQAFAGQTQSALSLFNQLSQMSGLEGAEINNIRADLLEGFARSQGMGVENRPIFRAIIDNLRADPGESPEVVELKKIYNVLQQNLAEATRGVEGGILDKQNNILQATTTHFLNELKNVQLNFNQAQLNLISAGIGRPGRTTGARPLRRSQGGVVYASEGAYVNYQPRGTDTIPAMLTPGEFVVNAKASKQHAGLLTAINNSAGTGKTFSSGGVVYAQGGLGGGLQYAPHPEDIRAMRQWPSFLKWDPVNGVLKGNPSAMAKEPGRVAQFIKSMRDIKPFPKIKFPPGTSRVLSRVGLAAAGPIFGGIDGYMADPKKTGVSRTYNTIVGAATGGGTTMGDVGAQSGIGSMLGIEPGSALDTQIGNWSQLGLTASQYAAMGVPYPYNLVAAGVALNANEMVRLQSDMKNSRRMREVTDRMRNSFVRSGGNDSAVERRAIELSGGVIQHKGMSSAEVAWIKETGKLQAQIMELKDKDPKTSADVQKIKDLQAKVKSRYQNIEKERDDKGQTALFARNQEGYIYDSYTDVPTENIEDAVNRETLYQKRLTENRVVAKKEIEAEKTAQKKREEAEADKRYQDYTAMVNKDKERKAIRAELGLSRFATDEQVAAKEQERTEAAKMQRRITMSNTRVQNMKDSRGIPYDGGDDIAFLSHVSEELPSINALDPKDRALYEEGKRRSAEIDSIKNEKWDPNGFHSEGVTNEEEWARDRERRLRQAYKDREKIVVKPLTESFRNKGYDDPATLASYKNAYYDGKEAERRRRERVTKQRQRDHEKGRDPRTFQRYNSVANNFGNMNPRQQQMARANVGKALYKYGVYDPSLSQDENIDRMHNAGVGHLAPMMYPGAQTQHKGLRVKNIRGNQQAQTQQRQQRQRRPSPGSKESRTAFFKSIYASEGMLVPYEPRGTDTVPAMLTPGEFVINKAATQKHRPLLESINRSKGGSVSYLADGGSIATGRMVDGMDIERENPLLKKMDENIAKTTQAGNIAAAGRNFSQQGLTNIKDGNKLYNIDRNQGTPVDKDLASHVTDEHIVTRRGFLAGLDEMFRPGALGPAPLLGLGQIMPTMQDLLRSAGFSSGGVVYASEGKYVNFEPKGTDTVPAMLTPGEFVVNAKASQKNLGLLHAINSDTMSKGGIVYAQQGGMPSIKQSFDFSRRFLQARASILTEAQQRINQGTANSFMTVEEWQEKYGKTQYEGNKVDISDIGAVRRANIDLVNNLMEFSTDDEGKRRLLNMASQDFGIRSITIGGPRNSGRNIPNADTTSNLMFGRKDPNIGLYQHEVGHALQTRGGWDASIVQDPDVMKFLQDKDGYIKLWQASGMMNQGVGYSPNALLNNPSEIFTNMIQFMKIAKGMKERDDGKKTYELFDNAFRKVMQSMNYQTGGIVYAQQGLNLDPNAKYKKQKEIAQTMGVYPAIETMRARAAVKQYEGGVLNKALRNAGIKSAPQMKFYQAFIKELEGTPSSLQNIDAFGPVIDPENNSFGNIQNNKRRAVLAAKRINLLKSQFANLQQIDGNILKQVDAEVRGAGMSGNYADGRSSLMAMILKKIGDLKNLWKTASVDPQWQQEFQGIQNLNKGGPVYASNGMLIPYRPQGTDTVPAMLTPGEFVVNKTATQQHLPALQAMNQGGRVAYLSNGTPGSDVLLKEFNKLASAVAPVASNFENLLSGLQNLTNNGGGGVSTSSIGSDALSAFGQIFSNFINSVNAISLPESINVRMEPTSVNVKISGTEALGALEEKMQSIIQTKLTTEINQRIENYLSTRE